MKRIYLCRHQTSRSDNRRAQDNRIFQTVPLVFPPLQRLKCLAIIKKFASSATTTTTKHLISSTSPWSLRAMYPWAKGCSSSSPPSSSSIWYWLLATRTTLFACLNCWKSMKKRIFLPYVASTPLMEVIVLSQKVRTILTFIVSLLICVLLIKDHIKSTAIVLIVNLIHAWVVSNKTREWCTKLNHVYISGQVVKMCTNDVT